MLGRKKLHSCGVSVAKVRRYSDEVRDIDDRSQLNAKDLHGDTTQGMQKE